MTLWNVLIASTSLVIGVVLGIVIIITLISNNCR